MGVEDIPYNLSDHSLLKATIESDRQNVKVTPKELFISSLINNPKPKHLHAIGDFHTDHWESVINQEFNDESFRKLTKTLRRRIPVVTKSNPRKAYKIEKEIDRLLKSNAPIKKIEAEVMKLRKYSYQEYIT